MNINRYLYFAKLMRKISSNVNHFCENFYPAHSKSASYQAKTSCLVCGRTFSAHYTQAYLPAGRQTRKMPVVYRQLFFAATLTSGFLAQSYFYPVQRSHQFCFFTFLFSFKELERNSRDGFKTNIFKTRASDLQG